MGLDAGIYRKTYIGNNEKLQNQIKEAIGQERPVEVVSEVAYWRKANQIHRYFIEEVGNGEDDQSDIYVSIDNLHTLYDRCQKVLEDHSKAEELLPTQAGFFFGSTEYGEWYFEDLERTIKQLDKIFKTDGTYDDYVYWCSW